MWGILKATGYDIVEQHMARICTRNHSGKEWMVVDIAGANMPLHLDSFGKLARGNKKKAKDSIKGTWG